MESVFRGRATDDGRDDRLAGGPVADDVDSGVTGLWSNRVVRVVCGTLVGPCSVWVAVRDLSIAELHGRRCQQRTLEAATVDGAISLADFYTVGVAAVGSGDRLCGSVSVHLGVE